MGEVIRLPRQRKSAKKSAKKRNRRKVLVGAVEDPHIRSALMALYANDRDLDRVASQTFKRVFKRLEALEAIVFAQSILIAELRGNPLTPEQRTKIVDILRVKI